LASRRFRQRRFSEIAKAVVGHVAEVAAHVHHFVVAVECAKRAAGFFGALFHFLEQIQDFRLVVAAIEDVAGLNDDQLSADPFVFFVDRAGQTQRAARGRDVAVHVAERDDSVESRESERRVLRDRRARRRRRVPRLRLLRAFGFTS
jgi:hypothetical protein